VANFKQRLNERRAARRARKLKRRRERDEAISEREPRARRRHGPSPSEVYTRGFKNTKP
jgi:hypothetical protein